MVPIVPEGDEGVRSVVMGGWWIRFVDSKDTNFVSFFDDVRPKVRNYVNPGYFRVDFPRVFQYVLAWVMFVEIRKCTNSHSQGFLFTQG